MEGESDSSISAAEVKETVPEAEPVDTPSEDISKDESDNKSELSRKISSDSMSKRSVSMSACSSRKTSSITRKLRQSLIEGFVWLHNAIEYIQVNDPDHQSILGELIRTEDKIRYAIDDNVLKTFKITFGTPGEGVIKFDKKAEDEISAFSASVSANLLPSRRPSTAHTTAPSYTSGSSGNISEASEENLDRQSRANTPGIRFGETRSRSQGMEQETTPPTKRHRSNSPKLRKSQPGYKFNPDEKNIDFQGTFPASPEDSSSSAVDSGNVDSESTKEEVSQESSTEKSSESKSSGAGDEADSSQDKKQSSGDVQK